MSTAQIDKAFDFFYYQFENKPIENSFVDKKNEIWQNCSSKKIITQGNQISRGLLKLGIKPQDKIALITPNNRSEWHIMDLGIQQVGAITVPLYPTLTSKDFAYILNHSESKFCFVADRDLYNKINSIKSEVPSLVAVYTFDSVDEAPNWDEVLSIGENESTQYEVDQIKELIKPEDVLTIIYTSGTTGVPKGVVLSHKNIVSNVLEAKGVMIDFSDFGIEHPRALSFLPINHIFERTIVYWYIYQSISVSFAESIETISDNLKEIKPHLITAVPRLLEKVFAKIYAKGQEAGGIKTKLFNAAINIVTNLEPFSQKNKSLWFRIKLAVLKKLVFSKWKEGLGGELLFIISGSAALSPKLVRIFHGAGIPILEGYGLTETSPAISFNEYHEEGFRLGSVGRVLKNLELIIAEDGEIRVKGSSVFKEYYKDPENTKEAFDSNGYFMTGDIGVVDSDGFLKITDRKKSMFKTSGGKYIAPQILENEIKLIPLVEQVMVVGEGEKMPCAIVQPNFENVKIWAKENNLSLNSNEEIANSTSLKKEILKEIEKINVNFGKWEQIKNIELTPFTWTIENDLLTPTMKMKRKNVMEKTKDLYKKLYTPEGFQL